MNQKISKKSTLFIFLNFFITLLFAQELDLSEFQIRAHYDFVSGIEDVTGQSSSVLTQNPVFEEGGILSKGCYVLVSPRDTSCLIQTPRIYDLNDPAFAIQIEFKVIEYPEFRAPVIVAGRSHRYLGFEYTRLGEPVLLTNNSDRDIIDDFVLEKGVWYQVTLIHNAVDMLTYVYIDGELAYTKLVELNHPEYDNNISNTNFSNASVFRGYWRNLKVFSKRDVSPSSDPPRFYPNPTQGKIYLSGISTIWNRYLIYDIKGILLKEERIETLEMDISELRTGLYILEIRRGNDILMQEKVVKI